MFTQLLQYNDLGLFVLRAAVAVIFLVHGFPKLSKSGVMGPAMGMPSAMVFLLGLVESVSALALIAGVYTQLAAFLLALVMVGALSMKALKWGVPFSAHDKTGWEFDFVLLCASLAISLGGGGTFGL